MAHRAPGPDWPWVVGILILVVGFLVRVQLVSVGKRMSALAESEDAQNQRLVRLEVRADDSGRRLDEIREEISEVRSEVREQISDVRSDIVNRLDRIESRLGNR